MKLSNHRLEQSKSEIDELRQENVTLRHEKQRPNLPKGLTPQTESTTSGSFTGKVTCDEEDCEECKHILNPVRHFLFLTLNPIIEKCKGNCSETHNVC